MAQFHQDSGSFGGKKQASASNVKPSGNYERFGETIRYLTVNEWLAFLSCVDQYEHKLMLRTIYELGCRVGEFARIQLLHVDLSRGRVFFPRENTKTNRRRVSHLPPGLVNELKSWLKQQGRMSIRKEQALKPGQYLFSPRKDCLAPYTANRVRQIFRKYARKCGLDRVYGQDSMGRNLHELTVHSLRHAHVMHYIHVHKLPIAVVQKQVGHTSLKTTSVYLNPSEEAVSAAYRSAQEKAAAEYRNA